MHAPATTEKECSTSPRPLKKCRKRELYDALVDEDGGGSDEANGSVFNQLVLYNPAVNHTAQYLLPASDPGDSCASNHSQRVPPSVGAFTIQCATCFKWRLMPTKGKYEEIREHIVERPFTCQQARGWRPDVTCEDPTDISQDGSRIWAIDKPSIAQPPPGWERQIRIRGEGGTKFADVYYATPTGKKLRSMVEVQKFLLEHPEYVEQGVKLSQFSFQIPRPLQENYVRKRPARMPNPLDGGLGLRLLEPEEVNPISWAEPSDEDQGPPYRPLLLESQSPPQPIKKKGTKPKTNVKNGGGSSSSGLVVEQAKEEL